MPYDPEIFFEGEEITMAIRAYCAGFRLFCPGVFIGAHLYQSTRNGAIESRPHRFWDEDDDADRRIKWHQKNDLSMTKVEAIWRGNWFGIFGIQDLSYYREFMHQLNILFGIKIPSEQNREQRITSDVAEEVPNGLVEREKRGQLVVVGAGIKAIAQLTIEVIAHIKEADIVFYNPTSSVMSAMLKKLNRNCFNLRRFYGEGKYRQITYIQMADALLREVQNGKKVVAVFHGHPNFFVSAARRAVWQAKAQGLATRILPGVSSLDNLLADLMVDPGSLGMQIVKADRFLKGRTQLSVDEHVVIIQPGAVGDPKFSFTGFKNTKVREMLEKIGATYGDDHEIVIYRAAAIPGQTCKVKVETVGHILNNVVPLFLAGASIYIPPKHISYTETLELQCSTPSLPKAALGQAIYTPSLEMAPHPEGFNDSFASPAFLRIMENISNDANELAVYEQGPQEYLANNLVLNSDEQHY